MQALLIKKDQIEYQRTRAIVQALVNKDAADEALKTYRDTQMPYLPRIQKDDRSQHIKRLMSEVARGPMRVTAAAPSKPVKSKLKTRHVQRSAEEQVAEVRRFSKKIGSLA